MNTLALGIGANAPAFHSSKSKLVDSLKEGGRGTSEGARRNKMRSVLVVSELAIAVVLLVCAGLLLQSLWRLRSVNGGLQAGNVLTFNVGLPEVKYKYDRQTQFFIDLRSRLDFDDRDKHGSTPVIIITETFARQYFPNEDPIGKRIEPGISSIEAEDTTMREIIGIVGDVRNRSLNTEARAAYYVPHTQVPFSQMVAVTKTTSGPRSLIPSVTKLRPGVARNESRSDGSITVRMT